MRILCLFLLLLTTGIVAFAQEPARVDSEHGAGGEVRRVQDTLIDAYVHRDKGLVHKHARRYHDAIAIYKKVANQEPTFADVHDVAAEAYWGKRM